MAEEGEQAGHSLGLGNVNADYKWGKMLNVNRCVCTTACDQKVICCAGFHVGCTIDLLICWLGVVDRVCLCVFPASLQAVEESWCCPDEPGFAVWGEASYPTEGYPVRQS